MTLTETVRFTTQLATQRAGIWYLGRLRGDPLSQLALRDGALDPYPTYERIRGNGVLSRSQAGPWVTASHRLCNEVLRDRRFGVRQQPYERREPAPLGHEDGTEWELSFLELDPPDHTRLRRLAMPAFSPKMITGYREQIEKVTHRLLDDVARKPEFDLMRDIAAPLPIAVITELLGIPAADTDRFTEAY